MFNRVLNIARKIVNYVVTGRFITGAISGGAIAFVAQVIFLGDPSFGWFWAVNGVAAVVGGLVVKEVI